MMKREEKESRAPIRKKLGCGPVARRGNIKKGSDWVPECETRGYKLNGKKEGGKVQR